MTTSDGVSQRVLFYSNCVICVKYWNVNKHQLRAWSVTVLSQVCPECGLGLLPYVYYNICLDVTLCWWDPGSGLLLRVCYNTQQSSFGLEAVAWLNAAK